MNGVFYSLSAVRMADILDGTSNTIGFGERGHTIINQASRNDWHWWTSGNYGDTMFTTYWPMNPTRKLQDLGGTSASTYIESASSLHPGGANFAPHGRLGRFLKDTIDTWKNVPSNSPIGAPAGVTQTTIADPVPGNTGATLHDLRCGPEHQAWVYQKLSTKAGAELINSSDY